LSETPAGKNSPELVSARARLDAARFANAPLSAGELEEIYAMVTGMLKHSASSGDIV